MDPSLSSVATIDREPHHNTTKFIEQQCETLTVAYG
jgi:hypothetical protein